MAPLPHALPPSLRLPLELQDVICRDTGLGRKDLARLALTCRAWYIAANTILWENIRGLGTLLALMPEGTWNSTEHATQGEDALHTQENDPPLTDEHWTPVLKLSPLVKSLTLNDVSRAVQRRVIEHPPSTTLFPSLRSLKIDMGNDRNHIGSTEGLANADLEFLRAIIPPTLRKLTLNEAPMLLNVLPLFPQLAMLDIMDRRAVSHEQEDISQHGEVLSSSVEGIPRCEHLSVVYLRLHFGRHSGVIEALSRLPVLKCLILRFRRPHQGQGWLGCDPVYSEDAFPALERLKIDNVSFRDVAILLKSHKKRSMVVLRISSCVPETPRSLSLLTEHVRKYRDPAVLQNIWLTGYHPESHWSLSFAPIAPLMAFRHLAVLSIFMSCGVNIAEEEWALLGQSWPALRHISMRPKCARCTPTQSCTLASLATIPRHCALIEQVLLPLDAAVVPALPEIESPAALENCRATICVVGRNGKITNAEAVVNYLRGVIGSQVKVKLEYKKPGTEAVEDTEAMRRAALWVQVSSLTLGRPLKGGEN
ncbi:hypothetical protein K523DRAFT_347339 [Schizophyllum commune Tattone D]|nr:hypothetical protein K523DRAFT_347339 [Schizophyllum commune Tattone D]